MASLVEKYEKIFIADPRSRIFVELAKALVEQGDHGRAAEVCQKGLEHHPKSILGRVLWGRALLESGDAKGAMGHFEIAIALEPSSPYAYNLVGEVLLRRAMHREALPVLVRAAELQPADARVKGWLEEAKRHFVPEPAETKAAAGDTGAPGSASEPSPASPSASGREEGTAPAAAAAPPAAEGQPAPDGEPGAALPPGTFHAAPGAAPKTNGAAAPPPLPPKLPKQPPAERSILQMIPGATREMKPPGAATQARIAAMSAPADAAEAAKIAAKYERELRQKLMSAPEPPPPFFHKHRRALITGAVAVAVVAAAVVYLVVDARNAAVIASTAGARGRAGLARDTLGSLRDASRLLSEARRRSKKVDPEILSLSAQVAAVLAVDYGDDAARETAKKLASDDQAGDGAVAARWLLGERTERKKAAQAVLDAGPKSAPLLHALAGRILMARGDTKQGRTHLEIAARANPPLLRALSDLGDADLAAGDADEALAVYGSALAAHATHARSTVGAAEARLLLGRDLDVSRKQLEAVEADAGSAPARDLRVRFEIAFARVLAATGDPGRGSERLTKAMETVGEAPELGVALAELHLAARAWDKAEAVAARAVKREPRDAGNRLLLARAQNGRGRYAEALATIQGQDGRAFGLQRAIAYYGLGQFRRAMSELEKTARGGKMAADAAVWYALTDVALGRAPRAQALLEKLTSAKSPPPLVYVALGRALEARGNATEAESAYRTATEREPNAPEGWAALGTSLLAAGKSADAVAPLERAAKLDPLNVKTRRSLGEARLAAGKASEARKDFDFVLLSAPRDANVLRLLSAAWLAEGEAKEARRAGDQAALFAPRDPAALVAAARAALAAGEAGDAKRYAERALKARAKGSDADEARRIASEAGKKAR